MAHVKAIICMFHHSDLKVSTFFLYITVHWIILWCCCCFVLFFWEGLFVFYCTCCILYPSFENVYIYHIYMCKVEPGTSPKYKSWLLSICTSNLHQELCTQKGNFHTIYKGVFGPTALMYWTTYWVWFTPKGNWKEWMHADHKKNIITTRD